MCDRLQNDAADDYALLGVCINFRHRTATSWREMAFDYDALGQEIMAHRCMLACQLAERYLPAVITVEI